VTGTTTCAVGDRDGQVVLQFPEAVQWAAFDPETARQIGEAMAKAAYKARFGVDPGANMKSQLVDQIRTRLHASATQMIRSMINKRDLPGVIAQEVVDLVLREVT
jgi:hypothetical protein